ncbi:MAG: autotransporter-associated beta strand repeat-containing protein, partial [Lentisphaerae bacterium]|nr:autotransporter-associated beta strand repeat-containing protein [Lentisphaerota bacterium]
MDGRWGIKVAAIVCAVNLLLCPLARAASMWWDGSVDNSWKTIANWSTVIGGGTDPVAVPGAADDVFFNANAAIVNQIGTVGNVGQAARGLTFRTNSTTAITISATGARILTIGAGGITNESGAAAHTIASQPSITLGAAQTWNNLSANTFTVAGAVVNGGFRLTINGTGNTTIGGILSGANGLTKNNSGTLTLEGVNTFTGVITNNAGKITVGTINDGGVAGNLGAAAAGVGNLVLAGGTLSYTGVTAGTTRGFTLASATTSTIEITTAGTVLSFGGGTATDNGALTKTGAGTLKFTNSATAYSGLTLVSAGTLEYGIDNMLSTGPVT